LTKLKVPVFIIASVSSP